MEMKRVEANDPATLHQMGNIAAAIVFSTKAAALGDVDAHYKLAFTYLWGGGVEKDEERGLHNLEEAAVIPKLDMILDAMRGEMIGVIEQ